MDAYPFVDETSVRFRDTDAMAITHHAVILSYLEEARTAYLMEALELENLEDIAFTIAHVDCDYRAPSGYGDRLETGVRVSEVGTRSFEMDYRVRQADSGELVAEARTVQVQYDYETGSSAPLPEGFRRRIRTFELERTDETLVESEPTEQP